MTSAEDGTEIAAPGTVDESVIGVAAGTRIIELRVGTMCEFGGNLAGVRATAGLMREDDIAFAAMVNRREADRMDVVAVGLRALYGDAWPYE